MSDVNKPIKLEDVYTVLGNGVVIGSNYLEVVHQIELEKLSRILGDISGLVDAELERRTQGVDKYPSSGWDRMPRHSNEPNPLEGVPRASHIECATE